MEKALRFLLWTVGIFVVLCLLGRLLLFETWKVPEGGYLAASLAPTLNGGDLVLVLTIGESKWGDLVRCPDPEDPNTYVAARVLGMPGDHVQLKGRRLRVNGKLYDATEACDKPKMTIIHPENEAEVEIVCARVELGNNWHKQGQATQYMRINDTEHDTGSSHVYLLSDNRDIHDDSRDYGALEKEQCNQRIFFRLWGPEGWLDSESRLTFIR